VTDEQRGRATLGALARDAGHFPDATLFWPLMLGAWKRKDVSAAAPSSR
jgi:hypothetical protein